MGKVAAHLCLTLIIKEFKFSVEHDRVVINNTKYNQTLYITFSVVRKCTLNVRRISMVLKSMTCVNYSDLHDLS